MNNNNSNPAARRSLLSGLGVAALAGVAVGSAQAKGKPRKFEPRRHALDAWMDALPGDHRVFIDTDSIAGAGNALRYATNILNAQVNAYKGADQDLAIIICLRHASTTLGFNDAMWAKFGSSLGAMMARPPAREPGSEAAPAAVKNAQASAIAAAAARGVQFAICDTATTLMSGMVARQSGLTAEAAHTELVANLVPNGHMVPAGVIALTRAQEYGYSFLYSAA